MCENDQKNSRQYICFEEEYKSLRNEIFENSKIVFSVFVANTTVTSAIIGYALNNKYGPIFLSSFAILIPSMFFIASQLESTTRISQYLRIFLEPEFERKWQTRWYELRARNLIPTKRKYTFAVTSLYGALAGVCLILAYLYWDKRQPLTFYIFSIPIIFLMGFGILSVRRAFSQKFRVEYARKWEELKTILNDENDNITPLNE